MSRWLRLIVLALQRIKEYARPCDIVAAGIASTEPTDLKAFVMPDMTDEDIDGIQAIIDERGNG